MLNCQSASTIFQDSTDLIAYEFFGATFNAAGDRALLVDRWTARDVDPAEGIRLSHQLISADWDNVAQLDLPLVEEGRPASILN